MHLSSVMYHPHADQWNPFTAPDQTADDEDDNENNPRIASSVGSAQGFSASRNRFFPSPKVVSGSFFTAISSPSRTFSRAIASVSSPSRDSQKMERPPPGPIKFHVNMQYVGNHSGSHNHRIAATIKASLIPSNAPTKEKGSASENHACEPSSPKVTCLGRVKIKQRYSKEMGKLASVSVAAQADKKQQPDANHLNFNLEWKKNPRRDKKEASIEVEKNSYTSTEMGLKGAHKAKEVAGMIQKSNNDLKDLKLDRNGNWSSAEAMARLKKSNHGRILCGGGTKEMGFYSDSKLEGKKGRSRRPKEGKIMELGKSNHGRNLQGGGTKQVDVSSDNYEVKGVKGRTWRLKEATSHVRRGRDKQKGQSEEQEPSHPQVSSSLDLSRFGSGKEGRILGKSLVAGRLGRPECVDDIAGFMPEVPPPNSLLLMRNSKNRETLATLASMSSSLSDGHRIEEAQERASESGTASSASKNDGNLKHVSLLKMNEHQHASALSNLMKMEKLSLECDPLNGTTKARPFRQASLPKHNSDSRLWQRRCIGKPFDIDVGKPSMVQGPITT